MGVIRPFWDIVVALHVTYGYFITAILSFIGAAVLFHDKEPEAVTWAKWMLWLSGPVSAFFIMDDKDVGISTVFSEFIFAIVWTLYLSKSERVKNTYRYMPTGHIADVEARGKDKGMAI